MEHQNTSLKQCIDRVNEWNYKVGHLDNLDGNPDKRWKEDLKYRKLAFNIMKEEVEELRREVVIMAGDGFDEIETLDAIADILYTLFGLAGKAGVSQYIPAVFEEVCSSNDSKLDDPVLFYKDGKVAKSKSYRPPNIEKVVQELNWQRQQPGEKRDG